MCKPSTEETSCVKQPAIHTAHRFSLQISVSSLSLELHRFQIHLSAKSIHILYTSRQMLIGVAVNVGRRDGMSLVFTRDECDDYVLDGKCAILPKKDELVRDWARSGIGSVYPAGRTRIRTDIVTFDSRALTDKQSKEKWQSLPASFPASTKATTFGFFSYLNRQFRSVTTSPCMFFVSSFNQGRVSSRFHLLSSSPL
uniref:Uncharacterized protein n=1 Tax=Brassica oleracea var. oleracea TaxID=109376 RepID=A0A0D3D2K6_BRAOL